MQRAFTVASIGVHTVVIAAALLAQVVAESALPTPHQPIMFDSSRFMPVDVQLPAPRAPATPRKNETVSASAATVISPEGVVAEPEGQHNTASMPRGLIAAVQGAWPPVIEGTWADSVVQPPSPPEPIVPVHLHSGMKAPVKIADAAPVYPGIARTARVQGVVILEAVLDAQGGVESVRVLRSIPLLDQAAVDAVLQWRFTPALLNGQPVPVVMTVTVNFTLR